MVPASVTRFQLNQLIFKIKKTARALNKESKKLLKIKEILGKSEVLLTVIRSKFKASHSLIRSTLHKS